MLAVLLAAPARALPKPDQVVRITGASLEHPAGAPVVLHVDAQILPGWHINSDRPSSPDYIATRLSITPPPQVRIKDLRYPPAESIALDFSMGEKLSVFTGAMVFAAELQSERPIGSGEILPFTLSLSYQACNDRQCLRPVTLTTDIDIAWPRTGGTALHQGLKVYSGKEPAAAGDLFTRHGFVIGFLLVLLGGLALNLTPCVYPLIGVTLAYFGNQGGGGTRRILILALLYVAGIALMFSAVGTAAALSGGLFGAALQNPYVLAVLAAVMLLLAASSFGWFVLQAPSWMLQRAGTARPGYLGALAMGLGMGVVAAPCIGPFVLGLLLIVERIGSPLFGFAVFFVLALGMGLPYVVLALAVGNIRSLPRSGEWLTWVEHLFGFVLIGLALYFLDPLLPDHVAMRLLPYYGAAVGIYLGFVSVHGRNLPGFRIFKMAVGSASAVALIFLLIPRGAPAPLPFRTFDQSRLSAAISEHKPVLLDFSADWCIPCREMEHTTFVNPLVVHAARRFVALRVDLTHLDSHNNGLVDRYGILGVPTVVLLNAEGKLQKRMVGYVGPQEMAQSLHAVN